MRPRQNQHAHLARTSSLWVLQVGGSTGTPSGLLTEGHSLELPEGRHPGGAVLADPEGHRPISHLPKRLGPAWLLQRSECLHGLPMARNWRMAGSICTAWATALRLRALRWSMNPEGSKPWTLRAVRVRVLAPSGKDCAWSPDGRWIVFDRAPNRGPAGCATELWIIPSTGGRPRYLAHGAWPVWAGEAGRVFYHGVWRCLVYRRGRSSRQTGINPSGPFLLRRVARCQVSRVRGRRQDSPS